MRKIILIFIASFCLLLSCQKDEPEILEEETYEAVYHTSLKFYIAFLTKDSTDLLDLSTPNYIKEEDVDIYYVVDGKKLRVYNPNEDITRREPFFIRRQGTGEDIYYGHLVLYPYWPQDQSRATTIISIDGYSDDRLEYEFELVDDINKCTKIWYKDQLVWPNNLSTARYFIIIK